MLRLLSHDQLLAANFFALEACKEQIRFKVAFGEAVLGVKDRLVLSDAAWERMAPLIIGRPDQKGSTGRDNRKFVEGVRGRAYGLPWRALPARPSETGTACSALCSRWSINGAWWRIVRQMSDDRTKYRDRRFRAAPRRLSPRP